MDGTLDFDCYSLGGQFCVSKLNNFTPTQPMQCLLNTISRMPKVKAWSKLRKFNIMPLRGQSVICQKMTLYEQLNDKLLVGSK